MKPTIHSGLGLLLVGCCLSFNAAAQFTPGNVVVYQVGNGAITGNVSAPVILKEFSPTAINQTTPVTAVAIPSSGGGRLVNGYTANSEGFLSLSSDSSRLTFGGYDTTVIIASVGTSTSGNIARVIDTIGATGVPGRVTITNSAFSANSIRAVTANNANNYWATGGTSAVYYMGTLSTPGTISTTPTNNRVIHALNGNLYFSAASMTTGIWRIKGQPFNTIRPDTPTVLIPTGSGTSPYGFSVNATETIAYVADDRTAATSSAIYRWTLGSGGTWTATDSLKPGTGAGSGARGITVDWSGTYPVVYATTTDNRLIRWVDSSNASHIYTVLATAPTNTVFRSVAFAPRAATCLSTPLVSISPAGALGYCTGDTIRLRTNKTPGLNYLWTLNGLPISSAATTDSAIRVFATGKYDVIINRNINCLDSAGGSFVTFSPRPNNQITLTSNDSVCAGDTIRLHSISGAGLGYNWSGIPTGVFSYPQDSGIILKSINTITTPIHFTLSSVVITPGAPGCRDTEMIMLTDMPLPQPAIVYNAGTLSAPGGFVNYMWYLNGNPVSGATSATYTPTANGRYAVIVTDSMGCSGGSADIPVAGVSVGNTLTRANIHIQPNPVTDVLFIDAPIPVSFFLRDMLGRTLVQRNGVREISLKNLPAGLFTITVFDDKGTLIGTKLLRKSD